MAEATSAHKSDGADQVPLSDLRSFYQTGEEVVVAALPPGCSCVLARHAQGDVVAVQVSGQANLGPLPPGTYCIEAVSPEGSLLAEDFTTIGAHPGERPVHGFATSFQAEDVAATLSWLRALRCTVVQVYDWMQTYSDPLGPAKGWCDPSGRPVSFEALCTLAAGIRSQGAVAHAYAPVYAVDLPFAAAHPELLMYRSDGAPERLFDSIQLVNPANPDWQRHFTTTYGAAADAIGFNGFHIDTYGFPRAAVDNRGQDIDVRAGYEAFLEFFRAKRPSDLVSFNQVNGVPSALRLGGEPQFRYCEVWAPNDRWRHLEGLMDRSSGRAGHPAVGGNQAEAMRGTIACYPPVWGRKDAESPVEGEARQASLRTVILTEAIATCLGAGSLLYGDMAAVLFDPYYPKHERLLGPEVETVLAWHRFALRCRDLFIDAEDTSWYEIGDENGAVAVSWEGPVSPEPIGGAVFARVACSPGLIGVGLLDLTGSANGSWSEPTGPGSCQLARVRVLLEAPEHWEAAAAVLGRSGGRFAPLPFSVVEHREGLAAQVDVPLDAGWSVLRLRRKI